MYKISWLTPLCVEVPQVQYIHLLSEQVHVLKAVAIVTSENLNLSRIFVVSHLLPETCMWISRRIDVFFRNNVWYFQYHT